MRRTTTSPTDPGARRWPPVLRTGLGVWLSIGLSALLLTACAGLELRPAAPADRPDAAGDPPAGTTDEEPTSEPRVDPTDPDAAGDATDPDPTGAVPAVGDPELRARWSAAVDAVDEADVTPTVIALHALLDPRLPIVDLDPATGPWTVSRTAREPAQQCHADAALLGILDLRQQVEGQPTHGPEAFLAAQTEVANRAQQEGWQLTTAPQFEPGHPAFDDGVRGTVHRLEGHGEVWYVTVSYEPDVVTVISYCPADLTPRDEPAPLDTVITHARAAISRGDHAEAAQLVDRALATDPTNRDLQVLAYARYGDELLHAALRDGDIDALATLAPIVPDVDAPDERFAASPLVLAAAGGHPEVVQLLLDAGADPNVGADRDGLTALMWAARAFRDEQTDMVRALLAAGADVDARCARGLTALEHAERYDSPTSAALLREHGGSG